MVKTYPSVKRKFSCPFLACQWRKRSALVRRIPIKAEVSRCPFERWCALMCRSSLMGHGLIGSICSALGHDLLFLERISANPLPYRFESDFSPHTFQASWPSPVFITPEFLITFNCPIDEISRNFQRFQEWKFENLIFRICEGQSPPHGFPWNPSPC